MKQTKSKNASAGKMSKRTIKEVNAEVTHEQLHDLFLDGIKDLYWAEKNLTKAIPKMIKKATSDELIMALENHLVETQNQVTRIEEVFASIEEKASAKKCDAMEGLIREGESIMQESDPGGMMDAGIIAAAQKIEHYEIASYGTLAAYAEMLGYEEAAELLLETLDEEKAADETLTEVTSSAVVISEEEDEEE